MRWLEVFIKDLCYFKPVSLWRALAEFQKVAFMWWSIIHLFIPEISMSWRNCKFQPNKPFPKKIGDGGGGLHRSAK